MLTMRGLESQRSANRRELAGRPTSCVTLFTLNVQNRPVHRDREQVMVSRAERKQVE